MEYRLLGRTGVQVSPLCLGCMNFGWKTGPKDSRRIIDRAIEAGINFLDTANVYAKGRSEEVVGEALQRNGRRDRIVLATKVHGTMGSGPNQSGNSRRHIIEQCEASLRRLRTDWIDLYQIHRPQSVVPIDETLRALDDLVRQGKVRYLGTSTFAAWQLVESLWVSDRYGLSRFVCEQPPYHILDRRIERELIPMADTYGIGIIPWSPLAGGLLTGKYSRDEAPKGSRYEDMESARVSEAAFEVIDELAQLVQAKGCSMSQFALAWCMSREAVTSPIIGPRTAEQLEDNLKALDVDITDEDAETVDRLVEPGAVVSPFYEADFGPAAFHW